MAILIVAVFPSRLSRYIFGLPVSSGKIPVPGGVLGDAVPGGCGRNLQRDELVVPTANHIRLVVD
jgi:hypothetical protein